MAAEDWMIRLAESQELPAVAVVYARSLVDSLPWLRPEQRHSEAEHREFFLNVVAQQCEVWVAGGGGQILGVLAMQGDEVDRLYVDTAHHGRGVGTALLDHAKAHSPAGLRLVTLQRNERARRFYERHGFAATEYGTSPPPESEPDVWYRWGGQGAGRPGVQEDGV